MGCSLEDVKLTSLEFGFNIETDKEPTELLELNVLMFDFKAPCVNPKNNKNEKYMKYKFSEYVVKIYNKSLEYHIKDKNILRIEVKYHTNKRIQKFGINTLADLKRKEVYKALFVDFMEKFNNLLIVDSFEGNATMSEEERSLLIKYTNPTFWVDSRDKERKKLTRRNTVYRLKKKCNELIKKHGLNRLKDKIRVLLYEKFNQLINSECECEGVFLVPN